MSVVMRFTYSDLKTVKTRSAFQVILEGPLEEYARFVEIFGGPMPGNEVPVALARLNEGADSVSHAEPSPQAGAEDGEKPRRRFEDMPPSQQAGIFCKDPEFGVFLKTRLNPGACIPVENMGVPKAADYLRYLIGIESRSELDSSSVAQKAFSVLVSDFRAWQADQRLPEQRG